MIYFFSIVFTKYSYILLCKVKKASRNLTYKYIGTIQKNLVHIWFILSVSHEKIKIGNQKVIQMRQTYMGGEMTMPAGENDEVHQFSPAGV